MTVSSTVDFPAILDDVWSCELLEPEVLETLPGLSVTLVINLSTLDEDRVQCRREASALAALGIEHAHLPILTPIGFTRRNALQLASLLATPGRVIVHAPGRERIGALIALMCHYFYKLDIEHAIEVGEQFGLTTTAQFVRNRVLAGHLNRT